MEPQNLQCLTDSKMYNIYLFRLFSICHTCLKQARPKGQEYSNGSTSGQLRSIKWIAYSAVLVECEKIKNKKLKKTLDFKASKTIISSERKKYAKGTRETRGLLGQVGYRQQLGKWLWQNRIFLLSEKGSETKAEKRTWKSLPRQ